MTKGPGPDGPKLQRFLDELASTLKGRLVKTSYRVAEDPEAWTTPGPLTDILGLSHEALSPMVVATLAFDGREPAEECHSATWCDFKWKLAAFHELQDVFDAPLYLGKDSPLSMFQL